MITHAVELKGKAVELTQFIEDEKIAAFSAEVYNAQPRPFKKGQLLIAHLTRATSRNYRFELGGTLEVLED